MTDHANATAAPVDVPIGKTTYTMSPLCDADYGELDNWLRSRVIQMARRSISEAASKTEIDAIMQAAFRYALRLTWLGSPAERSATLEDGTGTIRFFWQLFRKAHPKLTLDAFNELLASNMGAVDACFDALNLMRGIPKQEDPSADPTKIGPQPT